MYDRKLISGCLGLDAETGGGGSGGVTTANGSVGGNENVLKLDSTDSHTTF